MDELFCGFDPRPASEQGSDIAEIAVVRAASRKLDVESSILAVIGQIPARHRRLAQFGVLIGGVDRFGAAIFQVGQELRQGDLGLVEHEVVDFGK